MKLLLKSLLVIVGLLLIALVALAVLFDPDVFKPRIQSLAREQGIVLDIEGDISWQLWPALGIEINRVSAATTEAPEEPIAQLEQASLRVAIQPLLRGEVVIHHVAVDGAVIELSVDPQGRGNWEPLLSNADVEEPSAPEEQLSAVDKEPAPDAQTPANDEPTNLQLAVERINLSDSAIHYVSHQQTADDQIETPGQIENPEEAANPQRLSLQNLQVDIEHFNLQGEIFTLAMQWQFTAPAPAGSEGLTVDGSLTSVAQLAPNMSEFQVGEAKLKLAVAGDEQSMPLELRFDFAVRDLQSEPHYSGELNLAPFSPKELMTALGQAPLRTREAQALTSLAVTASISGDSNSVALNPLTILLDETRLKGQFSVTDFTAGAFELLLEGDGINVDHYLAPAAEAPAEASAKVPTSSGDEPLIPLDALKPLQAKVSVDFKELTIANMPLTQFRLRLNAKDAVIRLERFSADLYGGTIVTSGSLNARTDTAVIEFESGIQGLQLEPLMRDQQPKSKLGLAGALNAAAEGTTHGLTLNELLQAANGEANFAGDDIRISPLNIEQQFCRIVDLVNQVDAPDKSWPEFTPMKQLSGQINLVEGQVTIEEFAAGVEHLVVGAKGELNLFSAGYDITLPLTLTKSSTSETGCRVQSDFWLNRSLSLLRCQGSLSTLDPAADCGADKKGLKTLTKDFAAYKLQQKYGEEIEAAEQKLDKKKAELRDQLEEELGEEGQKLEDRLKAIFR